MKKIIFLLTLMLLASGSMAQYTCQAHFYHDYDPVTGRLYLYDSSYNTNMQPINVTSRTWTVSYGNSIAHYNTQDITVYSMGYSGPIWVSLTISTSQPCQDNYSDSIYVVSNPALDSCRAQFHFTLDTSFFPHATFYNDSHTNLGIFNYWSWTVTYNNQLIDSSHLYQPDFTFPYSGVYTVCLTASSTGGCVDTHCENITLPDTCYTDFNYLIDTTQGIYTVHLADASYSNQGSLNSWYWYVTKNGAYFAYSGMQNPSFTFTSGGTYVVKLTTGASGCSSSHSQMFIVPYACAAAYTYTIDSTQNPVVGHFYDASVVNNGSVTSWNWSVQHNGAVIVTSSLQNPVFTFPTSGNYNVCLQITTSNSCTNNYCQYIWVPNSLIICQPIVSALVNHVSVINGNDGSIDLTVTGGLPPFNYSWNTGDSTQDISNLTSGFYSVAISSSPVCPTYTYSYTILEPYDSINIVVDTLYSNIIDTCFNFTVDSFYIAGINVQGNSVLVEWVLIGGLDTAILEVTYTYSNFGSQVVVLTVNCNGAKDLTTYISYIYISQIYYVAENNEEDMIRLFPNPVSDLLNVTFENKCEQAMTLSIFSEIGKQVYFKTVAVYSDHLQINVSDLSSGFYIVRIDSGDAKPVIKKFVK